MTSKFTHTLLSAAVALGFANLSSAETEGSKKIEEVIVSSRLPDNALRLGTSFSVITEQEIQARGHDSLTDVLITEPGLGVSRTGGNGSTTAIRIRGEEGFRTQLRIDGVLIADPTAPQISPLFEDVTSAGIERIEILRGPQGVIYGGDAGGVISVTSKRYEDSLGGSLDVKVGSDELRRVTGNVGGSSDQGHFFASYSNFDVDGFNVTENDLSGEDDGYENETFHINGQYNVTEQVSVSGLYRKHEGENQFDNCFNAVFASTNNCRSENDLEIASVAVNYETEVITQRLSYSKTDVVRDSFSDAALSFGSEGEIDQVEYLGSYQLDEAQRIIVGAEWREESDSTNERNQQAVFVNYQTELLSDWFADVSARYDDTDDFGSFDNYRVATSYLFPQSSQGQLKFKANYGTGFRVPSIFEQSFNNNSTFGPAAGLQLSEETSEGYDVGIEWISANDWHVTLTWFDQDIDDAITFDLVSFSGYVQEVGTSNSQGVEFEFDWLVSDALNVGFNYTYNDTEDSNGGQRLRRPENIANLTLAYDLLSNLRVNAVVRSVRDAIDIGGVDLDDYETVDLTVNYSLSPDFDVYANAYNVFDEDYQEVNGFNNAGQTFTVGGRYQF
ncbi:TonB-dependent receptor plug domain-containing protein [Sessilibacter corallicola]|uniref:TonB-dependent receptor plug domain-containing protein n=1 Tax=Sessilibacter corallicola TaxID=2904075 RepID=UPI001E395766|nr:TonB-dependent receptor [Sessilibacter corallicola]MCE2026818.1 TonB-dependent receptor [Sessilibacter corallicola]